MSELRPSSPRNRLLGASYCTHSLRLSNVLFMISPSNSLNRTFLKQGSSNLMPDAFQASVLLSNVLFRRHRAQDECDLFEYNAVVLLMFPPILKPIHEKWELKVLLKTFFDFMSPIYQYGRTGLSMIWWIFAIAWYGTAELWNDFFEVTISVGFYPSSQMWKTHPDVVQVAVT